MEEQSDKRQLGPDRERTEFRIGQRHSEAADTQYPEVIHWVDDPLAELIQNALDAVDARRDLDENWYASDGTIHLQENTISVTDNGIGFTEEGFFTFLAPHVSFKTIDNRGNKGVGATNLAYGFNHLEIGTKTREFSYVGTIKEDASGPKKL